MHPCDTIILAVAEIKSTPGPFVYSAIIVAVAVAIVTVALSTATGLRGPLPFPGGEGVLRARVVAPEGGSGRIEAAEIAHWRANATHLADIGGIATDYALVNLGGRTFKTGLGYLTEEVPGIVGVQPLIGRWPRTREASAVVIGYSLWENLLDKDPRVLQDGAVRTGDRQWRIAGVMPAGFKFPFRQDMWWVVRWGSAHLKSPEVVLRLSDAGASQDAARALAALLPGGDAGRRTVRLLGFTEERGEAEERLLLGAVAFVVLGLTLVACTNLGNLIAEHTLGRAQDLAMHQSIGGCTAEMVAQRLSESTLVGILGSSAGVGLAWLATQFLDSALGNHLGYFWAAFRIDPRVCVLAILLGIAIPAIASLLPTLRTARLAIAENLALASLSVSGRNRTLGSWIVMNFQLAVSGIVAASAIVVASAAASRGAAEGLDQVWLASASFDGGRFADGATLDDARRQLVQSAAQRSGIVGVSLVGGEFLIPSGPRISALDRPAGGQRMRSETLWVTPEFFDTLAVDVIGGAPLAWGDPRAVWINQAFLGTRLEHTATFGERLRLEYGALPAVQTEDVPIRGIVADLHLEQRDFQSPPPSVYLPLEGSPIRRHTLIVRADGTPDGNRSLGEIASHADAGVMIGPFETVGDGLEYHAKALVVMGNLVIAGAAASVAVFAIGVFGLISLELEMQKKDYAVRRALGATALDVWVKIVLSAAALLLPGLLLCIAITWYSGEILGIYPANAASLGGVLASLCAVFLATAALAAGAPGLRLIRRNPADILSEA